MSECTECGSYNTDSTHNEGGAGEEVYLEDWYCIDCNHEWTWTYYLKEEDDE